MPCTSECVAPTPAQCHCGACHETFSGITLFDRHRRDGKCLPISAIALQLRQVRGVWRFADQRPGFPRQPPKPGEWSWRTDGRGGWTDSPQEPADA